MSKTKLDTRQINIMAGMLARSNMGMGLPEKKDIARLKLQEQEPSLEAATLYFCQEFMESDEHERGFLLEAKGFAKDLRTGPDKCRKWWPDAFKAYETAELEEKKPAAKSTKNRVQR